MVNIFSFSLYGNERKYVSGLLENISLITAQYPLWQIWVYIGNDLNSLTKNTLSIHPNVKLIETGVDGYLTKFFRYFPIDDTDVDICLVRDADSRVNDRDTICISEFLNSDKLFHIIRDHPNHKHLIMAGMWGIKRGCLIESISELFILWKQDRIIDFWSDTTFLVECIYPRVSTQSCIHDDFNHFNEDSYKIPHIRNGDHFIGQVYEFTEDGKEFTKFPWPT